MKFLTGIGRWDLLSLLLICLMITSCRVVAPERPAEEYRVTGAPPRYSHITLPFDISATQLKRLINRELSGVVFSDTSFNDNGGDGLMLIASKSDSITLIMEGNQIHYRVPLKLWIKKRFSAGLFGLSYSTVQEARASIALRFRTVVSLNRDWNLNTVTTSEGFEWLDAPKLQVGSLEIPLPLISDMLVRSNMPVVTRGIDQTIRNTFSFRQFAIRIWSGLQSPFQVAADPPLWLKLTPVSVSTLPLQSRGAGFGHVVSIKTLVTLSAASPPVAEATALPPLNITSALPDHLYINLAVDLPFEAINDQVARLLPGMTFSSGHYNITVKDFNVYGQGDKLVLALHVTGHVRGVIYLTGMPFYNRQNRSLTLSDLGFSVDTRNVLVKSASWVLRSGIISRLTSALVFPVGDELDSIRKELNAAISQRTFLDHLRFLGTIDQLEAEGIVITPQGVKASFVLGGKISARFE